MYARAGVGGIYKKPSQVQEPWDLERRKLGWGKEIRGRNKMVKEPETTCQEVGQKECDISRKKGERLIASNASIKIRNEKETLDLK